MRPMSRTTYYKICDKYGIEAVSAAWKEHQEEMVKEYAGKDVILLGEIFNLWSKVTAAESNFNTGFLKYIL